MEAEGWYRDPFGVHTDRWISAGRPTALVRDGAVESQDEPPTEEFVLADLVPADLGEAPTDGSDLKRADAATSVDQAVDPERMWIATLDGALIPGSGLIDPQV